jgi:hypothetical protein
MDRTQVVSLTVTNTPISISSTKSRQEDMDTPPENNTALISEFIIKQLWVRILESSVMMIL